MPATCTEPVVSSPVSNLLALFVDSVAEKPAVETVDGQASVGSGQ
jgi:hypothetical protein